MAEPNTSTVAVAVALGAGSAGLLSGFNPEAAVGALCGSILYFSYARELPITWRLVKFLISFVMGYLCAPAMAKAELFGFGPIDFPGPAAFLASAMIVTLTMAAMRGRSQGTPSEG